MRVDHVDERHCVTSVPFRWRNQNPFKSTYFWILSMAAELSSGAPAMIELRCPESVALIIVDMQADFIKRASTKISSLVTTYQNQCRGRGNPETGEAVTTTVTTEAKIQTSHRRPVSVHLVFENDKNGRSGALSGSDCSSFAKPINEAFKMPVEHP